MRRFIRCLNHLLLGAILGMIVIAVNHSSPSVTQILDWTGKFCECHVTPELLSEILDHHEIKLAHQTRTTSSARVVTQYSPSAPCVR